MRIKLSNQSNEDADVLLAINDIAVAAANHAVLSSRDSCAFIAAAKSGAIVQLAQRAAKDMLQEGKELRKIRQAAELIRDIDDYTTGNITEIIAGCKAAAGLAD